MIRGSDGGGGSDSAAQQDSCETGHSEVRVSWLESLAGVFVTPKLGCFGTILSMHLPVGFPGRLSSLKTWSFCSFFSQLSHVSWARSVLVASPLSFMQ